MSPTINVQHLNQSSARPEGGRGAPALGGGSGAVRLCEPDGTDQIGVNNPLTENCNTLKSFMMAPCPRADKTGKDR